jgi:hypothetical protein
VTRPAKKTAAPKVRAGYVLVLRTCYANGQSYGGFQWPNKGPVSCPDWSPERRCGFGLHGLLWGEGDGSLLNWSEDALWLVVEVAAKDVVDLDGKVKFPRGRVLVCGTADVAVKYLQDRAPAGKAIVRGTATAGDRGTATAGYGGTATAGDRGTATAGDSGTATAGDRGTATAGYGGTATAGDGGTATAGDSGTATAGDRGTATAGDRGTATAGDRGTATAGDRGTATAGDGGTATAGYGGTATAGYRGTATAGDGGTATAGYSGTATAGYGGTATAGYGGTARSGDLGIVVVRWIEWKKNRYRLAVGYVGEDGIKPNTYYGVDENGKLVERTEAAK